MDNILLTCAGRRNYLVQYFKHALAERGQVFTSDSSETAPALREADRGFLVPSITDPDYFDILLGICRKHDVRLLFSLSDIELPLLARQRERFADVGTFPVVPSPAVVDLCLDKWETWKFLGRMGISTPRTYNSLESVKEALSRQEVTFPLVVKPRWGTASFGINLAVSLEEMELEWRLGELLIRRSFLAQISTDLQRCLVAQEKVSGNEYGLDIVNDLQGRHVTTFVRRKLAMRGGETDKAVTVSHPGLEAIGRRIGESLQHVGCLDCDIFVDGDRYWVLEMNPRFGGGYPFSHCAGANLPAALVAWAFEEPVNPAWLCPRPDVVAAKHDHLMRISLEDVRLGESAEGFDDPLHAA